MAKLLFRAIVLGAIALGAWQFAAGGAAVYADHEGNIYNCDDFASQAEAQDHLDDHPDDQDNLDTDEDGIACEQYDYGDDHADHHHGCSSYYQNQPYAGQPYPYGYPYPYDSNLCHIQPPHVPAIIPAPSRPGHISMVIADTSIECNTETAVVARLVFPNGVGASAHMIQFQSTAGTVFSNVLTDPGGYAQTRFVAPMIPGQVQITAFGDGLTQTQTINVTCKDPYAYSPHQPGPGTPPSFKPPSTGDAGLVDSASRVSTWLLAGAAMLALATPAAAVAVVRQRNR